MLLTLRRKLLPPSSRYFFYEILLAVYETADLGDRAVSGMGLWSLAGWDGGFKSRRDHGCLSVINLCVVK